MKGHAASALFAENAHTQMCMPHRNPLLMDCHAGGPHVEC